jgi:hypothetical protein
LKRKIPSILYWIICWTHEQLFLYIFFHEWAVKDEHFASRRHFAAPPSSALLHFRQDITVLVMMIGAEE